MAQPDFTPTPLDGRVVIITGASSGIGEAMARRFAAEGSKLVLAARRAEPMQKLADALVPGGVECEIVPTDVTDAAAVDRLVARALERFGRVDVMINNAGNAVAKAIGESSPEEIDLQIDVNLKGVAYGCRSVVPVMIEQGEGFILNIGSICSVRHFPQYASYVAAKFGVLGLSRSVYEEVREHGVRCHCLCPAAVNTPWSQLAGGEGALPWPREQRLQPEDLAEIAVMMIKLPRRVTVDQLTVWPACESTA